MPLAPEAILQRLRARDESGMQHLYDQYSQALYLVVYRVVQEEQTANEVLHDAFVKIWRKIDQFDQTKSGLYSWMVAICRNAAIDRVRSKNFRQHQKIRNESEDVSAAVTSQRTETKEDTVGVKELVETLDPNHKQLIDLVYFNGYTHKEAAEELDIPLGTAKTRIRLAIKELRKWFNE